MKTKILLAILALSVLVSQKAKAIPVITVSYVNDCWLGCGNVVKDKVLTNAELPGGGYYTYWAMSITCSGFWVKSCPKEINTAKYVLELEPEECGWVENNSLDMWDYANNQLANDNNSGTHSIRVYNVDLSRYFTFVVTWNKWQEENEQWKESITVTMEAEEGLPPIEG